MPLLGRAGRQRERRLVFPNELLQVLGDAEGQQRQGPPYARPPSLPPRPRALPIIIIINRMTRLR